MTKSALYRSPPRASEAESSAPPGGRRWVAVLLGALGLAAAVGAMLFERRLVAAGNNPSGAAWAVGMLGCTSILAFTSLGWIAISLRAFRGRLIELRAMALTAGSLAVAVLVSARVVGYLLAEDYLSSFRGRWILLVIVGLAAVLLGRWLERVPAPRRDAALAGICAAAGALAAVWLWRTVGEGGYESFPAYAAVWTLVMLGAAAALVMTVTATLMAVARRAPAGRLLEIGRRTPAPEFPSGVRVVIGVTLLGGVLRFATLDVQSFWGDEAFTVWLVRMDLGAMLTALAGTESNPPLYYVLAWTWAKVFGTGEFGLRSLSALAGTATVPLVFYAARQLSSPKVAVVAAGLVAVHPMLVNYSHGARNYSLFVLLGALSLLLFARSLARPTGRNLGGWALASGLALATHYFALFLVAPAGAWLLYASTRRRALVVPFLIAGATAAALAPLALLQAANGSNDWIAASPAYTRLYDVVTWFSVGDNDFEETPRVIQFTLLGLAGWLLLTRAGRTERRGALLAGGLGVLVVSIPLALELAGQHYLLYRNVIVAVPLLAIIVGAGFGARRAGWTGLLAAGAFGAVCVAVIVGTTVQNYQRDIIDWRAAAAAVGPPADGRVIVLADANDPSRVLRPSPIGPNALDIYIRGTADFAGHPAAVREIVVLEEPSDRPPPASPVPGFGFVERRPAGTQTLYRFRSPRPVSVTPESFSPRRLGRGMSDGRLQRGAADGAALEASHSAGQREASGG